MESNFATLMQTIAFVHEMIEKNKLYSHKVHVELGNQSTFQIKNAFGKGVNITFLVGGMFRDYARFTVSAEVLSDTLKEFKDMDSIRIDFKVVDETTLCLFNQKGFTRAILKSNEAFDFEHLPFNEKIGEQAVISEETTGFFDLMKYLWSQKLMDSKKYNDVDRSLYFNGKRETSRFFLNQYYGQQTVLFDSFGNPENGINLDMKVPEHVFSMLRHKIKSPFKNENIGFQRYSQNGNTTNRIIIQDRMHISWDETN